MKIFLFLIKKQIIIMRDIKSLILEQKECGVCNLEADDCINASYQGDDYVISRHAFGGGTFGIGSNLHFGKNLDNERMDLVIVKLSKKDKIQDVYNAEAVDKGHLIKDFYCPACGRKLK